MILVAGDAQLLKDDVKQHAPWAESVILKQSLSRLSAKSPSLIKVEIDLRKTVRKAVLNHKHGKTQLLTARKPVKINVTFIASHFADVAEMLPTGKRTGALNVEYTAENMTEAYKTFELLVLAANGVSAIMESLR